MITKRAKESTTQAIDKKGKDFLTEGRRSERRAG